MKVANTAGGRRRLGDALAADQPGADEVVGVAAVDLGAAGAGGGAAVAAGLVDHAVGQVPGWGRAVSSPVAGSMWRMSPRSRMGRVQAAAVPDVVEPGVVSGGVAERGEVTLAAGSAAVRGGRGTRVISQPRGRGSNADGGGVKRRRMGGGGTSYPVPVAGPCPGRSPGSRVARFASGIAAVDAGRRGARPSESADGPVIAVTGKPDDAAEK